jgi:hypothetical protein
MGSRLTVVVTSRFTADDDVGAEGGRGGGASRNDLLEWSLLFLLSFFSFSFFFSFFFY